MFYPKDQKLGLPPARRQSPEYGRVAGYINESIDSAPSIVKIQSESRRGFIDIYIEGGMVRLCRSPMDGNVYAEVSFGEKKVDTDVRFNTMYDVISAAAVSNQILDAVKKALDCCNKTNTVNNHRVMATFAWVCSLLYVSLRSQYQLMEQEWGRHWPQHLSAYLNDAEHASVGSSGERDPAYLRDLFLTMGQGIQTLTAHRVFFAGALPRVSVNAQAAKYICGLHLFAPRTSIQPVMTFSVLHPRDMRPTILNFERLTDGKIKLSTTESLIGQFLNFQDRRKWPSTDWAKELILEAPDALLFTYLFISSKLRNSLSYEQELKQLETQLIYGICSLTMNQNFIKDWYMSVTLPLVLARAKHHRLGADSPLSNMPNEILTQIVNIVRDRTPGKGKDNSLFEHFENLALSLNSETRSPTNPAPF